MKTLLAWCGMACLAAAMTGVVGCDSDDGNGGTTVVTNNVTNATSATLSGAWTGTIAQNGNPPANIGMGIVQSGNTLSGTYQGTGGVNGTMTGEINGDTVTMTVQSGAAVSEWTGTANDDRDVMTGTFTIIAGGGGSGIWTLTKP
ncbi:MAG: hypothetical protein FJ221_00150 [Lentisphaerae bacterium]|nr:hypothetical protein [Lentisphaerota bacterium]